MQLSFERHVPHNPEQMLALVADVRSYPDFVPNCTAMDVHKDPRREGRECNARMQIKFGPISQAYTSRVIVDEATNTVRARALDGPFSHLDSLWTFTAEEGGTKVMFEIDFAISNPLLAAVAEPAFAAKQREIVDAFIQEAHRRYAAS